MKRSLATVALVAALVSLSACAAKEDSDDDDFPESRSLSERGFEPAEENPSMDDLAYETLISQTEAFDYMTRDTVDDLADAACEALDGLSVDPVYYIGAEEFGADTGALLAYSTWTSCPQHQSKVDAWADS